MEHALLKIIERAIDETNRTRKRPIDKTDLWSLRLYGTGAVFDSMQLVNFLALVEQLIEDEVGSPVYLTSEKAVSMKVTPFSSVRTLVDFIQGELSEGGVAASA